MRFLRNIQCKTVYGRRSSVLGNSHMMAHLPTADPLIRTRHYPVPHSDRPDESCVILLTTIPSCTRTGPTNRIVRHLADELFEERASPFHQDDARVKSSNPSHDSSAVAPSPWPWVRECSVAVS